MSIPARSSYGKPNRLPWGHERPTAEGKVARLTKEAKKALKAEDYAAAAENYRQILNLVPEEQVPEERLVFDYVYCLIRGEDYSGADAALDKAETLYTVSFDLLYARAVLALEQSNFIQASTYGSKALKHAKAQGHEANEGLAADLLKISASRQSEQAPKRTYSDDAAVFEMLGLK